METEAGKPGSAAEAAATFGRSGSFGELLDAAAAGDRRAIDAVADVYLPRLTAFAANRGAADPEGIADVVLFSVLRRLDDLHFEAPEQLWAYLCRTARSRVIDEYRRAKPLELVEDPAALAVEAGLPARDGHDFDDHIVDRDYVSDLLSPLTDEQRQVLQLRFLDDLSIEETANRTGRTQGAVKGLQRRAINAIIAAVAVVLVVLAVRSGLGGSTDLVDQSPTDRIDRSLVDDGAGLVDEDGAGPVGDRALTVTGTDDDGGSTLDESTAGVDTTDMTDATDAADATGSAVGGDARSVITVGTRRAVPLADTGEPGSVSGHGVRIYCPASHVGHGDPLTMPGPDGSAPARLFWGNTSTGPSSTTGELAVAERVGCEGGVTSRSAYWIPALFDEDDQLTLPEHIRVEYKAFGGPSFDRRTVQPIPDGLQLVAGPSITGFADGDRSVTGGADQVTMSIGFPSCLAVDGAGAPLLSGGPDGRHLRYPGGAQGDPSGCPQSHPYRIPTLGVILSFDVPLDSGWYLAPSSAGGGPTRTPAAGALSIWEPAAMDQLVSCVVAARRCEFIEIDAGGDPLHRGQLPERLDGPDGGPVYRNSVLLDPATDRTPFGREFPSSSPRLG